MLSTENPGCPYFEETRRIGDVELELETLSRGGDPGDPVRYPLTFHNPTAVDVSLILRLETGGWEVMPARLDRDAIHLPAGETAEVLLDVTVSPAMPPGGREGRTLRIHLNGDDCCNDDPEDTVVFTTVRRLPSPFLLHTEDGWNAVTAKMAEHPWMAQILTKLESKLDDWSVPDTDPSGDFVFNADACRPVTDLAAAWTLTGKAEYGEKLKTFLLRLSDPQTGYPQTGKAAARYAVKEGILFQHAAIAYDAIREGELLTVDEKQQIEKTLGLFIRDWAVSDGRLRENRQFTYRLGLDNACIDNHHLSIIVAGVFCSLLLHDVNHLNRFLYGVGGFTDHMSHGIMDDGFWYETDPGYHFLVAGFLIRTAIACRPWGIDLFHLKVHPRVNRHVGLRSDEKHTRHGPCHRNVRAITDLIDNLIPLADYRGMVFANNKSPEVAVGGGALEAFYDVYRKPDYAWALNRRSRSSLQTLLYGVPDLPQVEAPRPEAVAMHNAGLYVLRSSCEPSNPREQLQVVLKCGSHGGGHGHFDQTALISIMRYGRWFNSNHAGHNLFKQSAHHHMVVVDQGHQQVAEPKLLLFQSTDSRKTAAVQVQAPWTLEDQPLGVVLQRRLLTVTDEYLLLADYLRDVADSDNPQAHVFDWLIHPVGLEPPDERQLEFLKTTPHFADAGVCREITDCAWYRYQTPLCLHTAQIFRGDKRNEDGTLKLDIHPLWPRRGTLMIGRYPPGNDRVAQEPAVKDRRSVSLRTEGTETRYLTVIEPYEDEPVIRHVEAQDEDHVRVELKDGRVHHHSLHNFTADGQEMAVTSKSN